MSRAQKGVANQARSSLCNQNSLRQPKRDTNESCRRQGKKVTYHSREMNK